MRRMTLPPWWLPKTKKGKVILVIGAMLCIAGSAYYAGYSAQRVTKAAEIFVQKYQDIDQRPYRAKL